MSSRKSNSEKSWAESSRREKLALVGEAVKPELRAAVMARVETHFLTHSMRDPSAVINVVMREAWREEHGDTAAWDSAARAAGVPV